MPADPDEIAEGAMHRALQGWPDETGPPIVVDRAQHMADMAAITEQVADEGGPLGSPTAFAVLRDIADAEPLVEILGAARCTMCGSRDPEPNGGGHPAYPHPHLISCPWVRATQIVGVKPDQPAPKVLAVCRCGHYERDHETRGWRACSRRDACGCQLYTERGTDGG